MQAVRQHRERALFYESVTSEDAVPVIVMLIEEEVRVYEGVPLVPVHRLNEFINELDRYSRTIFPFPNLRWKIFRWSMN